MKYCHLKPLASGVILFAVGFAYWTVDVQSENVTDYSEIVVKKSPVGTLMHLDTLGTTALSRLDKAVIETACCSLIMSNIKDSVDMIQFVDSVPGYISSIENYGIRELMKRNEVDKALKLSLFMGKAIDKMKRNSYPFEDVDRANCHHYANMAYLSQKAGKTDEASHYFRSFMRTDGSHIGTCARHINPYLIEIGDYDRVLENNSRFCKEVLKSDTINYDYLNVLSENITVYNRTGNSALASAALKKFEHITDCIRQKHAEFIFPISNAAPKEQSTKWWMVILGMGVVMLVIWERKKNVKPEEKEALQPVLSVQSEDFVDGVKVPNMYESIKEIPKDEKALYIMFKDYVREKELYLNPSLDRDFYAALMKVDRNRFAKIIQNHSHTNLKGFLNSMRLEHSVHLMRNNRDYSLEAIATESGIPSISTYYRLFKVKYGMSPNDFRRRI